MFPVSGAPVELTRNMTLQEKSSVSGVVRGPGGPVPGVEVQLYRWDPEAEEFWTEGSSVSTSDGTYRIGIDDSGSYALYFDTSESAVPLVGTWLGGAAEPGSPDDPGVFAVGADTEKLVRNQTLAASSPAIYGTVTGPDGPVDDVEVEVYRWDDLGDEFVYDDSVFTNSDGTYAYEVKGDGHFALALRGRLQRRCRAVRLARGLDGTRAAHGPGSGLRRRRRSGASRQGARRRQRRHRSRHQ